MYFNIKEFWGVRIQEVKKLFERQIEMHIFVKNILIFKATWPEGSLRKNVSHFLDAKHLNL